MTAICLYLQVHQPHRLRRYSVFDAHSDYFDDERNAAILHSIARKCYRPAMHLLLQTIRRHEGRFRLAFSLTGSVIEQFRQHEPQVIESLQRLAETGCCEFLGETYHHSLAFYHDREEFDHQRRAHAELIEDLFGQQPRVFRHTELIYDNDLASAIHETGLYRGILTEGVDHLLAGRSPGGIYHPPGLPDMALLLKNHRLSDDVAFRFSEQSWRHWPLTAEKFAAWVHDLDGPLCNLFMDFETFGEHQWQETGIFDFLAALPEQAIRLGDTFLTPSEAIEAHAPADVYDVPETISWADTERDLSAWAANTMQKSALKELYRLGPIIKQAADTDLLADWRKLTTSDHFYYMCTKFYDDMAVHRYFSPYESPYDSYINFMNVLDDLRTRAENRRSAHRHD